MKNDLMLFKQTFADNNILFCYTGGITHDIMTEIGQAVRKKMNCCRENYTTINNVFSIFVELVQNIIRYSHERELDGRLSYGILAVGKEGGHYFVKCGNIIDRKDVCILQENLDHIKSMDKQGLKTLFLQGLKKEPPASSIGAGVGFIEIARRAVHGFDYKFVDIDSNKSYFMVEARS